jgi:D-alanyl-D-alanine carboxypeptidase
LCLVPILYPLLITPAQAASPPLTSNAALLLDLSTRRVLAAKNPEKEYPPASLAKLMTLYLAFEAMEQRGVRRYDRVLISRRAAKTAPSKMGLKAGERVALYTLLEAIAIISANDAATAAAEHLDKTEEAFVDRMNRKAKALGLTRTRFINPHGLPGPGQWSTAQDLAHLSLQLLQDHPGARELLSRRTFAYRGYLHRRQVPLYQNPGGIQALKTGYTEEAGFNLMVTAAQEGETLLCILLGASTRQARTKDARQLLHYGFANRTRGAEDLQLPHRTQARESR